MKVRNINGTSDLPRCQCGTWLRHWENYTDGESEKCSVTGCKGIPEVGAHVQKEDDDRSWYIVPLCRGCNNQRGGELEVRDDTELIPVTARSKCKN